MSNKRKKKLEHYSGAFWWRRYTDALLAKTLLPLIPKSRTAFRGFITPNQMSWVRIALTPLAAYLLFVQLYIWGVVIFILAALTDAIDGALARTRSQITERGKILDAVADRTLIFVVGVLLIPRFFGWELFGAIVVLEAVQSSMALRSRRRLGYNPGSNWAGAVKMLLQSVAFGMLFVGLLGASAVWIHYAGILLYISLFFTFVQSFAYPRR